MIPMITTTTTTITTTTTTMALSMMEGSHRWTLGGPMLPPRSIRT